MSNHDYSEKHCFICQGRVETTRNPLKETVAGNFMHKTCADSMRWTDRYGSGTLVPDYKKKTRSKKG